MKTVKQLLKKNPASVLVRIDSDVPIVRSKIKDDHRLRKDLLTVQQLAKAVPKVIIIGHQGRPAATNFVFSEDSKYQGADQSLKPVANYLAKKLGRSVNLISGYKKIKSSDKGIFMLENLRFDGREKEGSKSFARE
ncbi:MAG: phosphoglycerate kinase, partial [Candidatus Komeilibacteria bacterium]|nr:phosphoglycerate kinase [Candidatus Komeilibacteria bacterium]